MKRFEVAVLGDGPTGQELAEILGGHPNVTNVETPSREELETEAFEGSEVVFSALGAGISARYIARFRDLGCTVIDLSGDLRFPTVEQYEEWYKEEHPAPQLVSDNVPYGLVEVNRDQLQPGVKLVSMPGCYATAGQLSLLPLVEQGLIETDCLDMTGLSGHSGRGKGADNSDIIRADGTAYNAHPYKVGREHQHVGEMEQLLGRESIIFTPIVLPNERGLVTITTARLTSRIGPATLHVALEGAYDTEPFVKVLREERLPEIRETAGTDECHIGFQVVKQGIVKIGGSIDNLRKGSATPAVQVFNLIHGLPEITGLRPKTGWRPRVGN